MNLLLLDTEDFRDDTIAVISDSRTKHLLGVIGVEPGSEIRCGQLGGMLGKASVKKISTRGTGKEIVLQTNLSQPPPPPSSVELLCALPRPKMLRRIVRTCAELGVKDIRFLNTYRVEKSYWQSPQLELKTLRSFCLEGLQQSVDTILPEISFHKRFKPYVEDELPAQLVNKRALLAHPKSKTGITELRPANEEKCVLAIGPEGGFIDYEINRLREKGFQSFSLGPRVLRCDTVVPYLIAALQAR